MIDLPKKLLVIDGYNPAGMAALKSVGATRAGLLYKRMLSKYVRDDQIDIVDISAAEQPHVNIDAYAGVCWTGSNLFLSSADAVVQRHIDSCRAFFAAGVPQIGSCWGAQLAAVTAGGKCELNPKGREFGIGRKILLNEAGQNHPMFRGKRNVFDAFESHADIVTELPDGAIVLASNEIALVQALEVKYLAGSFWAFQYHIEYDFAEMACLTLARQDDLIKQGTFKDSQSVDEYVADLQELHADRSREDIKWKRGIDQDLLDDEFRNLEIRNWLNHYFGV